MLKSRRIFFVGLVFMVIFLVGSTSVFADSSVNINISGTLVSFDENLGYPFIDENSRTQVPFRAVMEACGAEVFWDPEKRIASAAKGDMYIDIPIGESKVYKNGYPVYNDTYSRIVNGRTYLPIRIVLESLGYHVLWIGSERTVYAYAKDSSRLMTKAVYLPEKYDMRDTSMLDPVQNQGDTPNCWAYAATSALQSMLLPEEWAFSQTHMAEESGALLVYPEGGGTEDLAAAYYTNWKGPVLESDYAESEYSELPVQKHVQGFRTLEPKDFAGIKRAIYEEGPVLTAIRLIEDSSDPYCSYNYETYAQHYIGDEDYDHTVLLVGWDDNYPKENFLDMPMYDGAFIAKNSYGDYWGDQGFFYISYEDLHVGGLASYFTDIEPYDNYDYLYSTDMLGCTNWSNFRQNHAYYANIFNTEGLTESLMAVGIYSLNTNMDYEISIVSGYNEVYDLFNNATTVYSGHLEGEGYHTVKIPNPPIVNGDYAVIVHGTTTDEIFRIPYESPFIGSEDAFDINDGLGYISGGYTWYNSEETDNANVCLRAYTDLVDYGN